MKQILKQTAKISRILNKFCDEQPSFAQNLDLALYSVLKIERIIKKQYNIELQENSEILSKSEIESRGNSRREVDGYLDGAICQIDGLKTATQKLERKMNIYINQTKKFHYPIEKYIKQSPKPKQSLSTLKMKKEKLLKKQVQSVQQDESQNLSEIEASILSLTEKLKKQMQQQKQSGSKDFNENALLLINQIDYEQFPQGFEYQENSFENP